MTEKRELERSLKTKAVNEFLGKIHSAMADLDFDVDIEEDTMLDWNRALSRFTDEILVFEVTEKLSLNLKDALEQRPDGDKSE